MTSKRPTAGGHSAVYSDSYVTGGGGDSEPRIPRITSFVRKDDS